MRAPVIIAIGFVVTAAAAGAYVLLRPAAPPVPEPVRSRAAAPAPPEERPSASAGSGSPAAPARRRPAAAAIEAPEAPPVEAAPTTATLHVDSDVPGATVFIDRVSVGATPMSIPNLQPGPHQLNVAAPGYEAHGETIELAPGDRTITVSFKEIRLDAKVDAVHKHGMGSCKGRIAATPQGLRYEATDGKDSFAVTFADVAAFDIDYLGKNLRLRTRQGRTYNFTTDEPTADGLMRFHAAVDKVRTRLSSER